MQQAKKGRLLQKSFYISRAVRCFFETESEIWAVLVFMNFLCILSITFLWCIYLDLENRQNDASILLFMIFQLFANSTLCRPKCVFVYRTKGDSSAELI
jgi:hypothetical protein